AGLAGIDDLLALAATVRTGLLHREDAALHAHLAMAGAGLAGFDLAVVGTGTAAALADHARREVDFLFDAEDRLFQIQFQHVAQVGTAPRLPAATGATEDVAENVAENVTQIAVATRAATALTVDAGMPELVVALAAAGIAEHLVGFLDLLETFLGVLVAGIAIRMQPGGMATERGLQFGLG